MSLYRSARGERALKQLYDRAARRLELPLTDRFVETRFGETHVLVTGPSGAPPLVVLQGGNSLSPLTLAWYRPLARTYRVFAPDTVGHPGYSSSTRPLPRDESYGTWLVDVLDGLRLERPAVIGTSHGAAIALRAAAADPDRVGPAALVVPAGLTAPRLLSLVRLAIPALLYRLVPTEAALQRAVSPLFTAPPGQLWLDTLEGIFRHVRFETRLPRPIESADVAGWRSPAIVLAAEDDLLYPGRRVLRRAREILPRLRNGVLLEGSCHIPDRDTLQRVSRRIDSFLRGAIG